MGNRNTGKISATKKHNLQKQKKKKILTIKILVSVGIFIVAFIIFCLILTKVNFRHGKNTALLVGSSIFLYITFLYMLFVICSSKEKDKTPKLPSSASASTDKGNKQKTDSKQKTSGNSKKPEGTSAKKTQTIDLSKSKKATELSYKPDLKLNKADEQSIEDLYLTTSGTISLLPKEISSPASLQRAQKSMTSAKKWWVLTGIGYIIVGILTICIPAVIIGIVFSKTVKIVPWLCVAIVTLITGILWMVFSHIENKEYKVESDSQKRIQAAEAKKLLEVNDKNSVSLSADITFEEIRRQNASAEKQYSKKSNEKK